MSPRAVLLINTTLALLAALGIGCSQPAAESADNASPPTVVNPRPDMDDAGNTSVTTPPAPFVVGSPLCNVSPSGCHPDDPSPANAAECTLASTGAASDA